MKITVPSAELKTVLALVKAIGDCSAAKIAAHSVCTIGTIPSKNVVTLDFSFNGAFLSYTFREVMVEGIEDKDKDCARRSFDLSALANLKFPDKLVTLALGEDRKTIGFESGRLKGKIVLTSSESDEEEIRPSVESIKLTHTFGIKEFLSGLGCHGYGAHHNPVEVAKRPVRIYTEENKLKFVSRDSIVTAYIEQECSAKTVMTTAFDVRLLPKPLKTILSSLPQEVNPLFSFGTSKEFWRVNHETTDIWFPNIVKAQPLKIEDLLQEVSSKPSYCFTLPLFSLESALKEAAPFMSDSALASKEDSPTLKLSLNPELISSGKWASFKIETSKAKEVELFLEGNLNSDQGIGKEELVFNFKFLSEFVAGLKSLTPKKEEPAITIQWWKFQDTNSPAKGKIVSVYSGSNRYFIVRVKPRNDF